MKKAICTCLVVFGISVFSVFGEDFDFTLADDFDFSLMNQSSSQQAEQAYSVTVYYNGGVVGRNKTVYASSARAAEEKAIADYLASNSRWQRDKCSANAVPK
ncbi:MAG: hypothetical protein LBU84_00535 [Prevotella sp.]|jgi:hypothetical protein|nr:hypothetical protein [Prevotella sp.]